MEMIQKIWPSDDPFASTRADIFEAVAGLLGDEAKDYAFHAATDEEAIFRYRMRTLPKEVDSAIGTSTLYAAWNAATYVAQIEDDHAHDGLWFNDEAYVISRAVS